MVTIIFIILLVIFLIWVTGFLFFTDFSVPLLRDMRQFKHILVIFPHADDETITCGGWLHRTSLAGSTATLVILTKGEKGTSNATLSANLKEIRTREARAVASILAIPKLIQKDFGDGELARKKQELTAFIATTIEQEKPDLLITYDLAGFYGHADHIACSEIITELKSNRFPEIPLWYATFPKRILARVKTPAHMGIDPQFKTKRAFPTHKIFIGASVWPKIKAWYTYKSQLAALTQGTTKLIPLWFFLSMVLFEYFSEVS
jgi:LmbE family N-acetylglucosaminyl deacetylase